VVPPDSEPFLDHFFERFFSHGFVAILEPILPKLIVRYTLSRHLKQF